MPVNDEMYLKYLERSTFQDARNRNILQDSHEKHLPEPHENLNFQIA